MKVVVWRFSKGREEDAGSENGLLNEGITGEVEQALDNLKWKAASGADGLANSRGDLQDPS